MSEPIEDTPHGISSVDETTKHSGFRTLKTFSYREADSEKAIDRELLVARHAVAVVAYDPAQDRLVMIRQFRLGAQLGTGKGMCVEVVAGLIDDGEDPATSAKRELEEEAGLSALHLEKLCQFLTTPGVTDEVIHLFYAQVDASNLQAEAGEASESERTFPFLLSLEDALEAVDSNGIQNGIAMIALLWFARHKERLTGSTP